MIRVQTFRLTAALLVGLVLSLPVFGETLASDEDEWEFMFSPMFLWGVSLKGTSTIGTTSVPLDISFTDSVLENLAAVVTGHFEARKGKWGGFAEIQYVDMEPGAEIKNGPTIDVSIINKMAEGGVSYRVWGKHRREIQVIAGARWYSVDMGVALDIGPKLGSIEESWADGFVGGRVNWALSDRWALVVRADIGGGPIGSSDLVWNAAAQFDYRFNDLVSAFAGYRVLDYDYSTGSGLNKFEWDVRQQGPLAGISFHW